MPTYRTLQVAEILSERRGLQRVRLDDGSRAYALTGLIGPVSVHDDVVVNTTAVDLGLGTGGWHVVHWNLSRRQWSAPGPGHIMKLRYTSLQVDTGAAEEGHPASDEHPLDGMPVVVCSLHSQMAVVAVALKALRPGTKVVYVMTDGAALPLAISDVVADLVDARLLDGSITAGHAFGGDLESVNVDSGLELARSRLGADVVIVAMGPGVVGTGTRLGTTALEVASVLDTAAWMGASPIMCLRVSDTDPRSRHRGVSHHSLTALDAVRSRVVVPTTPGQLDDQPGLLARHHVRTVTDSPDVDAILGERGIRVTTMGRGPKDDASFFQACAAAATVAVGADRLPYDP